MNSAEAHRAFLRAAGVFRRRDVQPFAMPLLSRVASAIQAPSAETGFSPQDLRLLNLSKTLATHLLPSPAVGGTEEHAQGRGNTARTAGANRSGLPPKVPTRRWPLPPVATARPPTPLGSPLSASTRHILHRTAGFMASSSVPAPAAGFCFGSSTESKKDTTSSTRPDLSPRTDIATTTTAEALGHDASRIKPSPAPAPPIEPRPTSVPGSATEPAPVSRSAASTPDTSTEPAPSALPTAATTPSPVVPGPPAPPGAAGALRVLSARVGSARASLDRAGASLLAATADLGAEFNRVTGYDNIEQLKLKVDEATRRLADAREELRESRAAFEARVEEQGDVQRQQMSLLQRKSNWQPADLERFTELCRREHHLGAAVAQAKAAYGEAEEVLESCHDAVAAAVRERYSAETLWSDKIRRASTWWTAGLMGLNLVSFLSVYLVMEPIKARRLRNHVEEVLRLEMANVRQSLASLETSLHPQVAEAAPPAAAAEAAAVTAAPKAPGAGAGSDEAGEVVVDAGAGAHSPVSEILEHVRQMRAHVAAVERRLAGTLGEQHGGTAQAAEPASWPSPPPRSQPTPGLSDPATEVGSELGGAQGRTAPAVGAWRGWLGDQLYRVASRPEVTNAAAAFAGAALGVGLLLTFRDR